MALQLVLGRRRRANDLHDLSWKITIDMSGANTAAIQNVMAHGREGEGRGGIHISEVPPPCCQRANGESN